MFVRRLRDRLARGAGRSAFVRTAPLDPAVLPPVRSERPASSVDPGPPACGADDDLPVEEPPTVVGALRGAPPWVRALPSRAPRSAPRGSTDQRRAAETLLAVDEALRAIVAALGDRLDDTVIFVLSDNGYSFGEHRWEGKTCPYEACVRIPLAVYSPVDARRPRRRRSSRSWTSPPRSRTSRACSAVRATDGTSFAACDRPRVRPLHPRSARDCRSSSGPATIAIPAWTAVRTADFKLIRYADGFEELYDLGGRLGPADPWEIDQPGGGSAIRGGSSRSARDAPGSRPGARLD